MQVTCYILPGRKLQIMVDGVPFDEAKAASLGLLELLSAQGVPVQATTEVESHRDAATHVHQIDQYTGQGR